MDTAKDISTLYRKMNMSVNAKLAPIGLSSSKAMFLFCIYDHESMSQVEICRDLDMDKSTVAKMLMRLEKDGFILKSVNPEDVRSSVVRLTDKATALIPQAREVQQAWLEEITSGLTDLEKQNFFELIKKVSEALIVKTKHNFK